MSSDQSASARSERLFLGIALVLLVLVAAVEVAAVLSIHHRLGSLNGELVAMRAELEAQAEVLESLSREADAPDAAVSGRRSRTPSSPAAAPVVEPSAWDGLVLEEEGEVRVLDASVLEGGLADVDAVMHQVRALPHKGADGAVDGFRLAAIRRGSILAGLGIRNGDIVQAINGYPLTGAEEAMQAFEGSKDATEFRIGIVRRGEPIELVYQIR